MECSAHTQYDIMILQRKGSVSPIRNTEREPQQKTQIYQVDRTDIKDMYQRAFAGIVVDTSKSRVKPIKEKRLDKGKEVQFEYSSINKYSQIIIKKQ